MTISFVAAGALTAGAGTTVVPPFPAAGVQAGDIAVLLVVNKIETTTANLPTGFSAPTNNTGTGGAGSAVADDGPLRATVFTKVCDGTENGTTVTVGFSVAHLGTQAMIAVYRTTLASWDVAGCGAGSVSTGATAWSQAVSTDPGVAGGDWVVTTRGATSDAGAWTNPPPATVITGCTMGTMTQRGNGGTTNGNDLETQIADEPVSSGTSSAAATVKGTESVSLTGVVHAVRIREVAAATMRAAGTRTARGRKPMSHRAVYLAV